MVLPDQQRLSSFGAKKFANEVQLQRFFEDRVWPEAGLQLVSSSERSGERLGYVDTTALDRDGFPVLIEYKRDIVDRLALAQLDRYKQWMLNHRDLFEKAVVRRVPKSRVNWNEIRLVTVAYRYRLAHAGLVANGVELLRYGYRSDGTLFIVPVRPGDVGDGPPPVVSKDAALERHLAKTTPAAQEAFQHLRRRLGEIGLEEKIHGKNRVTYGGSPRIAEVKFGDVALQVYFNGSDKIDDPDGRAGLVQKGRWRLKCGIASPDDVEPVSALIQQSLSRTR